MEKNHIAKKGPNSRFLTSAGTFTLAENPKSGRDKPKEKGAFCRLFLCKKIGLNVMCDC